MRKLDTCDFCGGDPSGVYEVVPEYVPADTRRLVLCTDCRETLDTVVSPLVAALEGERDLEPADVGEEDLREPRVDDLGGRAVTGGVATDDGNEKTDADADSDADDPDASDDADGRASPESDGGEGDVDGEEDEDESAGADENADVRPQRPDGYAKVVRLLRNRPAAMPREDIVALASNAYDLDATAVETALDVAIENGHVVETAEGLRT